MQTEQFYGQTHLHPFGVLVVCVLAIFVLTLNRRGAIAPLLIAACAVPMAQRLIILGADFTMLRILIAVYVVRVIVRGEGRNTGWNRLDSAMVAWSVCGTLVMTLAEGTFSAFVNRLGWSFDMLGIYFIGRWLIRDWADLRFAAVSLATLSVPVAIMFAIEWATAFNVFSIFGGVPSTTWIREGRLRCQGAFAHPILAGTFWAAALPLIWTLRGYRSRLLHLGTFCSLFIVAACSSSTPILAVVVAVVGAALFPWRKYRTWMWTGLFALLTVLHIVMEAPVWHLMSRLDFTGGSTGYHRFAVLDAFIRNFSRWALAGDPDPRTWGVWQMRDVTNHYAHEGLDGGLITLIAFVLVLVFSFGNVGRTLKVRTTSRNRAREWLTWCVGVGILVHAVTFFGLTYFGQMIVIFYLQVSFAACVYAFAIRDSRRRKAELSARAEQVETLQPTQAR